MEKKYHSYSEAETMALAKRLGKQAKPGDIICLYGDLGAGKTHFVKGYAEAFGISRDEISSPTFNLIQEYRGNDGMNLYHFDCYRLESITEALEIGVEEYFYGDGVSIIEWPERISELLPDDVIRVTITIINRNSRLINIDYPNTT